MQSLFLVEAIWIALALPPFGLVMGEASNNKEPSYEVVSIRPHNPVDAAAGRGFLPDGLDFSGVTLEVLINSAYEVAGHDHVYGLPGWVASSYYDIQARVDSHTAEAWKGLSPNQLAKQQQPMLQSLLADRCQFKAHLETRELPVYDLMIAKRGLKMKKAPPQEKHGGEISSGEIKGRSTAIESLVSNLPGWSGRRVVDKTGLAGMRFDFDLTWTPEDRRDADPANAGPSIFTALEEQLGLKLVPSKALVQVLVIDHMERPTPN